MMKLSFLASTRKQKPLLGSFITFNTPYAAQLLARCGFDWLMVDMEHSPLSAQEVTNMVHATVSWQGSCMPIVRVPSHGVEWIKWALDSGADGIIIPMVNTKQEMDSIIKRAIYPPGGARSSGPFRTAFTDLDPTATMAKFRTNTVKDTVILPMIESVEGVTNAEAIMMTPGVDGVFIGPVDLRSSMGYDGLDGDEEEYIQALQTVLTLGQRLNEPIGILLSPMAPQRQVEMGFDFFLMTGDADLMAQAARAMVGTIKEVVSKVRLGTKEKHEGEICKEET
jgi:2-keto-3-deoxy-L-rhamnonate aldolase RhmA